MSNEVNHCWDLIYMRAAASSDLMDQTALGGPRIFKNRIPGKDSYPAIVGTKIGGRDHNSINQQDRLIAEFIWEIVVKSRGVPDGKARKATSLLDDLFKNGRNVSHTFEGSTFFYSFWRRAAVDRQQPGETPDTFYDNQGGEYVFQIYNFS